MSAHRQPAPSLDLSAIDAATAPLLERDYQRNLITSRTLDRRELTHDTIQEYRAVAREVIERYLSAAAPRSALHG